MSAPYRICLIDDDAAARTALERVFAAEGHEVVSHADGQSGLAAALEDDFDCVLTDLRMPGVSGMELIDTLRDELPNLPVVLMTAHGTTETAIEATRRGAFDYILKPFEMEELLAVVARAAAAGRRGREKVGLGDEEKREVALVGQSRAMQTVYKEIGRVAGKPVSVLILGETGTGKELVARALWQHGDRKGKAFVTVNCAAIPSNPAGERIIRPRARGVHRRRCAPDRPLRAGARRHSFSRRDRRPLAGDAGQAVAGAPGAGDLARRRARDDPGGCARDCGHAPRSAGARGGRQVSRGSLVPAQRRRHPPAAAAGAPRGHPGAGGVFCRRSTAGISAGVASVQPAALKFLSAQPWPGNVRQLENVVKRMLLLAHGYAITEDLVRSALSQGPSSAATPEAAGRTLAALCEEALEAARRDPGAGAVTSVLSAVERELLAQAHAATSGNITQMAQLLGWSRLTVREKLKLHGLRPEPSGAADPAG